MLTVAIDSGPLHGPQTGIGNAVGWMIDALHAPTPDDEYVEFVPYVTSLRARTAAGEQRLPIPAALAHRLWAQTSRWKMDRWLGRPDIVHGTNYVVPPTSAPQVVNVYDCWFLDHPEDAHPDVTRAGAVLRRSVDDGATVVTSSAATSDRVRDLLGVDAITIHLGPPPAQPSPARRPSGLPEFLADDPFVLTIGTAERRKNLPVLIDAFGRLGAEHESVRLVVAGRDGDDAAAVARALARLDPAIRARVHRMTSVDEEAKYWLLHEATALAYPSLDEGFGFPILEAQLAGTPVVASSAGSIPEVGGSAVLLSLPSDVDALAANLFWVVTSESQRERLVRLGRRNAERFSWESTANELRALYRRLGGRRPNRRSPSRRSPKRRGPNRRSPNRRRPHRGGPNRWCGGMKESNRTPRSDQIAVVSGGVGAARFLRGLMDVVDHAQITAVVNTGDDTVLHGLNISPDLDTVTYTLSGAIDPERGWGLVDESWRAMGALDRYADVRPVGSSAAPQWFNLGDQDLATHFYRTRPTRRGRLADGRHRGDRTRLGRGHRNPADDGRAMYDRRHAGRRRRRRPDGGAVPGTTSSGSDTPFRSTRFASRAVARWQPPRRPHSPTQGRS